MEAKRRRTARKSVPVSGPSLGRGGSVAQVYNFELALLDGAALGLTVRNPPRETPVGSVLDRVKEKFNSALVKSRLEPETLKRKKKMFWRGKDINLVDERKVVGQTSFKDLDPSKCYRLSLNYGKTSDAQGKTDLAPESDLFYQTGVEYDTESALAELIDKSICAACCSKIQNLVSMDINQDRISIFDTGNGCGVSSILNWGRSVQNLDTLSRGLAPRGRPPYLRSTLGKLGYGAYKASLHLGRHALVSSKTEESNNIYMLHFGCETFHEQGASCSDFCWKLFSSSQCDNDVMDSSLGDMLVPSQRSFTRIEVFDHVLKAPDKLLPCRIKDIYFPFIQSDDSFRRTTLRLVTFQVNGLNLAELEGGQIATMNLHSSNGPEFVVQLRVSMDVDKTGQKNPGVQGPFEANARLKCVYYPAHRGSEGIEKILKNESFKKVSQRDTFSHVYVRWLGRLLTGAQWDVLPFMVPRPNTGGDNYQVLKRCCGRVICFIDTDVGFISTPLKTNLHEDHPFTKALKSFGACLEEDLDVKIEVSGKKLNIQTLEKEYHNWVFQMHKQYDIENFGVDKPVVLVDPSNIEELQLSSKVVRVHKILERNGRTWTYGQPVKILKTVPGYPKTNLYAKLEYFLLEGLEGDVGGEASFTCRPLEVQENDGCVLVSDGNPTLDLRSSLSLQIHFLDAGKCVIINDDEWTHETGSLKLLTMPSREKQSIKQYSDLISDVGNSSPICKKRAYAEIKSGVRQWRLSKFSGQPYVVRMGSCFPPFSVAGYDAYENRVPFDFAPEVLIKVKSEKGLMCQVDNFIPDLSSDREIMNVKNLHIKASDIDKLRPGYQATLFMCNCDNSLEVQVPCKFMPGPLDQVVLLCSEQSTELHPGYVFKDLKLEMLDAYGNHVEEGSEITLSLDGIQMLDYHGLKFKVDCQGHIDLGGHLKVTSGYGKSVSLSVLCFSKVVFRGEFQIGKRELRMTSTVPEKCLPGSKLRNLVFEIIKSDGTVDKNVHDQDGVSHLLRVDIQLSENDSQLFAFQHGKCTVPTIILPAKEGCCWLVATHSDHPEICLRFEVVIAKLPKEESASSSPCSFQYSRDRHAMVPIGAVKEESDITIPELQGASDQQAMISYAPLMVKNIETPSLENWKNLKEEIESYGIQIRNHELDLQIISSRKESTLTDISALRDYVSKKEQMEKLIESKVGLVAAHYCHLSITTGKEESNNATNLLGLVAILGTAPCPNLARVLAEYLGEARMLAVVCKSSTVNTLRNYNNLLGAFKARACRGQQLYICLEDLRPYTGGIVHADDQQRRLALPGPMLNTGMAPTGFIGYAVNLIDINLEHVDTRIGMLEYGLRETLFYHLFRELQVYETREQMMAAWSCVKSGAVSLDGGIVKESGTFLLSVSEPEICFPVLSLNQPLDQSSGLTDMNKHVEAKITELGNLSVALAIKERQWEQCKKALDERIAQCNEMLYPLESLVCENGGSFLNTQEIGTSYPPSAWDELAEQKPGKLDAVS